MVPHVPPFQPYNAAACHAHSEDLNLVSVAAKYEIDCAEAPLIGCLLLGALWLHWTACPEQSILAKAAHIVPVFPERERSLLRMVCTTGSTKFAGRWDAESLPEAACFSP